MNHQLILCRSVTQAQRASMLLTGAGITNQLYRAPVSLSRRGCGYVVRIRESDCAQASRLLSRSSVHPLGWYRESGQDTGATS